MHPCLKSFDKALEITNRIMRNQQFSTTDFQSLKRAELTRINFQTHAFIWLHQLKLCFVNKIQTHAF